MILIYIPYAIACLTYNPTLIDILNFLNQFLKIR